MNLERKVNIVKNVQIATLIIVISAIIVSPFYNKKTNDNARKTGIEEAVKISKAYTDSVAISIVNGFMEPGLEKLDSLLMYVKPKDNGK